MNIFIKLYSKINKKVETFLEKHIFKDIIEEKKEQEIINGE